MSLEVVDGCTRKQQSIQDAEAKPNINSLWCQILRISTISDTKIEY